MMRSLLRLPVLGLCAVFAGLAVAAFRVRALDYLTAARLLALVPGAAGLYLRRYFYRWTLSACGDGLCVDWMAVLKSPTIRVGHRVSIGSFAWVAECTVADDVMIGPHVVVQGGPHTHGFARTDIPMNQQGGDIRVVAIGTDVWIGNGARVLADVEPGTVVGAGAVVTRTAPPFAVIAGVPARVLRMRESA